MSQEDLPNIDELPQGDLLEWLKGYKHDPFFKQNFWEPELAKKFLDWALPKEIRELLAIDRLEVQKESYLSEELKASYSDVLYKLPLANETGDAIVFVLLGHKTWSDQWTMYQIFRYVCRIWESEFAKADKAKTLNNFKLPPVLPIIVHHGEREFTAPTRFVDLVHVVRGFENFVPNFEGMLIDLVKIPDEGLPRDLELYAILAVMQAVFRKDVTDRLVAIYEKLKPKLHLKLYRDRFRRLIFYVITSGKYLDIQDTEKMVKKMGGVEDMTEVFLSLPERMYFKGEALSIIRTLTKRFKSTPKELEEKLLAITDLERLDKLADFAFDCQSLDEFSATLK